MITVWHNPRCRKSREALAILENSGEEIEVFEYLKTPPGPEALAAALEKLSMNPEDLVRKGEAVYKEKFKGRNLDEKQWLHAMADHPKLIERPIVIKGDKAVVGRPPEKVKELL